MKQPLLPITAFTLFLLTVTVSAQTPPFTFGTGVGNGFTPLTDVMPTETDYRYPQLLNRHLLPSSMLFTIWDGSMSVPYTTTNALPTALFPGLKGYISHPSVADGLVYFHGVDATGAAQPWVTNGTAAGTRKLLSLSYGSGSLNDVNATAVNGITYMTVRVLKSNGTGGANGMEIHLYKTNGTTRGTTKLKSWLGAVSSWAFAFQNVNGTCVFLAGDGPNSQGVWTTTGTSKSTKLVYSISTSGTPDPIVVGSFYYFLGDNGTTGKELWRSNGTSAGTTIVADLYPNSGSSTPAFLTELGGRIYFAADDGSTGRELYVCDPASKTISLAADIEPGLTGSDPQHLTAFNGKLYFSATTADHGRELWVYTPGTPGTATEVADIMTGTGHGDPHYKSSLAGFSKYDYINPRFTIWNNKLYFAARTANGTPPTYKMFEYDGNSAPIVVPGFDITGTNLPTSFTVFDGALYFLASDPYYGNCLWKYAPPPPPKSVAEGPSPSTCALRPGYPNPFSSVATLTYTLTTESPVRLAVFDMLGREVAVLAEGAMQAGTHSAVFRAASLPSGSYLVRLTAGGEVRTRVVWLLR